MVGVGCAAACPLRQTHPNAEGAAERRLNQQLFATHLPHRTTRVSRHGKITEHVSPCFPGYLFLLLDLAGEAWKSACHARGVLRLLPASGAPIAVTDEALELHQAELDGALVSGLVKPGSKLRVYRGALTRQVVECLAVDDHRGLVRALWSCFGRQVECSVPLDAVTVV
jgi:transcription antitermination factor NusG